MNKETIVKYAREEVRTLKGLLTPQQKLRYITLKNVLAQQTIYQLMYSDKSRAKSKLLATITSKRINGLSPLEYLQKNNKGSNYETNYLIAKFLRVDSLDLPRFRNIEF